MQDNYLTVSALTKYIKRKFATDPHLKQIWLKGEISNFKHHSRGHMYLTIKDDSARIQAVMFAGNNRFLRFQPENGMSVLIRGDIGVFERFGQYQLYIQQMEPDGIGSLYLAYEQLKKKLSKQGYFNVDHKKELPAFPEHIGIVTSSTGAAVRDIITTIKRRYPAVRTTVIPVIVQGEQAPNSITNGIKKADEEIDCDIIITGRGGGSIEELWSFNEEIVADALYNCQKPIISAVGHETDMTISDYVADLRAPTPTGAAELAVPSEAELLERLNGYRRSLTRMLADMITTSRQSLSRLEQSYAFRYPEHLVLQKEQELDKFEERIHQAMNQEWRRHYEVMNHLNSRLLASHPTRQVYRASKELKQLKKQMYQLITNQFEQQSYRLGKTLEKLSLLNPLETMKRGYAIAFTHTGDLLKSVEQISQDEDINVRLFDGTMDCRVLGIKEETYGEGKRK